MNKKILFLILLSFLIIPGVILAEDVGPIETIVNNIVAVITYIAAGITVILWIVTGLLFLSSMGDPSKLSVAKKALFASIGGTVLVVLAYLAGIIIENIIFKGI